MAMSNRHEYLLLSSSRVKAVRYRVALLICVQENFIADDEEKIGRNGNRGVIAFHVLHTNSPLRRILFTFKHVLVDVLHVISYYLPYQPGAYEM